MNDEHGRTSPRRAFETIAAVLLCLCAPAALCGANPLPAGACCMPDGSCWEIDEEFCAREGGHYVGDGVFCAPNPCPPPMMGACCLPDGSCAITTEQECAPSGVWLGAGAPCTPCNQCVPCYGACCWPDGTCTMESTYDCCIHGGDPMCAWDCVATDCATADVPAPGEGRPEPRKASWGGIRTLYR